MSLTPAGQVVYEHANRVLALLEEMEKAVIAAEKLHHFSLALTRQVEKVSLAQTIQGLLQANPSLDVELEILPAREVLSGVRCGRFDLGILASGEGASTAALPPPAIGRPASPPSDLRDVPLNGAGGPTGLRLVCRRDLPTPGLARQLTEYLGGQPAV